MMWTGSPIRTILARNGWRHTLIDDLSVGVKAERGKAILTLYRTRFDPGTDEPGFVLRHMLADLRHHAGQAGLDFAHEVEMSGRYYDEEREPGGGYTSDGSR